MILCLLLLGVGALVALGAIPTDYASAFGSDQCAQIVVVSGGDTYVALAPPGTLHTAATWQAKKITVAGGTTVIKWADGNNRFDNTPGADGAGLAALTYN